MNGGSIESAFPSRTPYKDRVSENTSNSDLRSFHALKQPGQSEEKCTQTLFAIIYCTHPNITLNPHAAVLFQRYTKMILKTRNG